MDFSVAAFWDSGAGLDGVWAEPDCRAIVVDIRRILGKREILFMFFLLDSCPLSGAQNSRRADADETQFRFLGNSIAATRCPFALYGAAFATKR